MALLLFLLLFTHKLFDLYIWPPISSRSLLLILLLLLLSLILISRSSCALLLLINPLSRFREINVLLLDLLVLAGEVVTVDKVFDVSEAAFVFLLGLIDPARLERGLVQGGII